MICWVLLQKRVCPAMISKQVCQLLRAKSEFEDCKTHHLLLDKMQSNDQLVALVKSRIRDYPDFPKPGIIFKDIFPVLGDPEGFQALMEIMRRKGQSVKGDIDFVVGLDSRGFLFGPTIALAAGVPFVPVRLDSQQKRKFVQTLFHFQVRKAGKLPGKTFQTSYTLEYGQATLEIQTEAFGGRTGAKVLVVDDLLATGGTMAAAWDLVTKLDAQVVQCFVVIELSFLKGRDKMPNKDAINSIINV